MWRDRGGQCAGHGLPLPPQNGIETELSTRLIRRRLNLLPRLPLALDQCPYKQGAQGADISDGPEEPALWPGSSD